MKKLLYIICVLMLITLTVAISGCDDGIPTEVTVVFDYNDGINKETQIIDAGTRLEPIEDPVRSNYTFAGWYLGEEKISLDTFMPTESVTLVAKWIPGQYKINYVLDEGTNNPDNPTGYIADEVVELKSPTRSGYMFVGWYTEVTFGTYVSSTQGYAEDLTLYARFMPYEDVLEFEKNEDTYIVKSCYDKSARVEIPSTYKGLPVTSIKEEAFSNCIKLVTVVIPKEVTNIGLKSFEKCSYLKEVIITGDGKTVIDRYAFSNCRSLKKVKFEGGIASIRSNAFANCEALSEISIPKGVKSVESLVFGKCYFLENVYISSDVESINPYAFSDCVRLKNVQVDEGNQTFKSIDGIVFSKDGTVLELYPMARQEESYTVPEGVTTVGSSAFYRCTHLKSITLPESLTKIESSAFTYCENLGEIVIPNSVKEIGSSAFSGCYSLKRVNIPTGIEKINPYTFKTCGMQEIVIPESVKEIGNNAFQNCTMLKSIVIPGSVTKIGGHAFNCCLNIKEIVIPDSVTEIGGYAFSECTSLKKAVFPNNTAVIGNGVFHECESLEEIVFGSEMTSLNMNIINQCPYLQKITVDENNPNYRSVDGVLYSKDSTVLIRYPSGKKTDSFIIPEGVTKIETGAFNQCTGIKSISIPATLTAIDPYAFETFTSLTEINVAQSNSVYMSANGVLYSKDGKTLVRYPTGKKDASFEIPSGVVKLGDYSFSGCTKLKAIVIPDNVTAIGINAFKDCEGLESVTLSSKIEEMGYQAFRSCDALRTVVIPEGMQFIGEGAFTQCKNLRSITIPGSVKTIGAGAFSYCNTLESVVISEGVETIGNSAFGYCERLKTIAIPKSVTTIEEYVFSGCVSLTSVEISSGVTTIGEGAFFKCNALQSVIVPITVTSVGERGFGFCSKLTVYCEAEAKPEGWHENWAISSKAVVWGYKPSEE